MDWGTVIAAAVTALCALIGTYFANKKQTALMAYRLEQLEKKVDMHNNFARRMPVLEEQISELKRSLDK